MKDFAICLVVVLAGITLVLAALDTRQGLHAAACQRAGGVYTRLDAASGMCLRPELAR